MRRSFRCVINDRFVARMTRSDFVIGKLIACILAMLLNMPLAEAAITPAQQETNGQQAQSPPTVQSSHSPDALSRVAQLEPNTTSPDAVLPTNPAPAGSQAPAEREQQAAPQSAPEQKQNTVPKPVGSAVAPYEKTTGVAASRPAGAVIAPAKQRQARSIVIRVSIVVGAAIAIGTVVALSHGSPSQPN